QHLRLDVDQRRRHDEELAGDVEVELAHQIDRVEVLLRDERDRDVVDVDLVPLDQEQQEIERPLEHRELDREGIRRRFEFGMLVYQNSPPRRTRWTRRSDRTDLSPPRPPRPPWWRFLRVLIGT